MNVGCHELQLSLMDWGKLRVFTILLESCRILNCLVNIGMRIEKKHIFVGTKYTHCVFVKLRDNLCNHRKVSLTLCELLTLKGYIRQSPQHVNVPHTSLLPSLLQGFQAFL